VVISLYLYGLSLVRGQTDLAQAESERDAALKALAEAKRDTERNNERIAELSKQLEVLTAQIDDEARRELETPEPTVHSATPAPTASVASSENNIYADMAPESPKEHLRSQQRMPSVGPSFDCAKATYPSERLVCSSAELAVLDLAMANAYRDAAARVGTKRRKTALRNLQNNWLRKVREACGEVACLREVYEQRIRELNAIQQ
jgi:uncharacterized protein YecT (DUF1311 family)